MDAGQALDHAFSAGLKVRGEAPLAVARASLVMHASRTLDPAPFLERGEALVAPAMAAFRKQGRADLELRAGMWLADAGRDPEVSAPAAGPLRAYRGARAWAGGGGGPENLVWIRDMPRDEETAHDVLERLLDHALAAGEEGERAAEAVLEAALADFPRASAYGLVFRAAALSRSAAAVDRTLLGLGAPHPSEDNPAGRRRLEALRLALALERMEAMGEPLEAAVEKTRGGILAAGLAPHVAAALVRKSRVDLAQGLLEEARAAAASAEPAALAALGFVARHADGTRRGRESTSRRLLAAPRAPPAAALVAGACDAARAVRDAWPAVDVAEALTGDSLGPLATASTRAAFQKDLFAVGGEAAAATGDRAAVDAMARTLKGGGLPPAAEGYLRATLADAAAGVAARAADARAFDLAQRLAGRSRDKFERAKLHGRVAMAFVRATEVPPMPVRWMDPLFGTSPAAGG
ncbi:MAG TPA: hypothetical protein VGB42_06630 [Candidatus Thermoplasmatota archaeon]